MNNLIVDKRPKDPQLGDYWRVSHSDGVSVMRFHYIDDRADEPTWYETHFLRPHPKGHCNACPLRGMNGCGWNDAQCHDIAL